MKMRTLAAAFLIGALSAGDAAQATTVFDYTGTVETFDVTTTGVYDITAFGAQGGGYASFGAGGLGAEIGGNVTLSAGTILTILVGGAGGGGVDASGGGGSTWIVDGATPLVVAGGGGGGAYCCGFAGGPPKLSPGGGGLALSSGSGSGKGGGAGGEFAGGGGGYHSSGGPGGSINNGEGGGYIAGSIALGGNSTESYGGSGGSGGSGGGGGGYTGGLAYGGWGGGGGGYTGGNGGMAYGGSGGGGGSSFLASTVTELVSIAGENSGNGSATIMGVPAPEAPAWATLLVGLGLGVVVYRRNKKSAAVRDAA
jgi:hypothetical protein